MVLPSPPTRGLSVTPSVPLVSRRLPVPSAPMIATNSAGPSTDENTNRPSAVTAAGGINGEISLVWRQVPFVCVEVRHLYGLARARLFENAPPRGPGEICRVNERLAVGKQFCPADTLPGGHMRQSEPVGVHSPHLSAIITI